MGRPVATSFVDGSREAGAMRSLRRGTGKRGWLVIAIVVMFECLCSALFAREAHAERVALIVANNVGQGDDEPLLHAEADADRMAATLTQLAGVEPQAAIVMKGQTAAAVRQGFRDIAARLEKMSGERVVFFYYSGHANAAALHLAGTELPLAELKQLLLGLPASLRVAVVDACQSGTLTRMKGGRPGVAFDLSAANAKTTGLAILSSTADGELAQESDALQASFFTYHFDAGLRGLADRNRNGEVTLGESFDYASERTTNTTLSTSAGPQHPSFRYDLAGQGDLVISRLRPTTTHGVVVFDKPGWYFLRSPDGKLIAEVRSDGMGQRLALEGGTYELLRREPHALAQGQLRVSVGKDVLVGKVETTRASLGRAVRKGGWGDTHATTAGLSGIWRSSLVGLGPWWGGSVGLKEDFEWASFEGKVSFARAARDTRIPSTTSEVGVALAAMRAFDLAAVTFSVGAQIGWANLRQQVEWLPTTVTNAGTFGPLATFEMPLGLRLSARGEVSLPLYWVRLASNSGASRNTIAATMQLGLGVGVGF